jgi:gluconokinase
MDPVEIDISQWQNREDEGILFVPKAGEILYRLGQNLIMALAIVLMGVSGCGKTSVGQALSAELGWTFYEGDDYHTFADVEKMSKGMPLNDEDRAPWLEVLHDLIAENLQAGENLVLACSALKMKYRQQLRLGNKGVVFVYLDGDFELIWSRMQTRNDHFMKPELLKSQFDTLETPSSALNVNIEQPITAIVQEIIEFLENEHDLD